MSRTGASLLVGLALAGTSTYYSNKFVNTDVIANGGWGGRSGNVMLGLSASALTLAGVQLLHKMKPKNGDVSGTKTGYVPASRAYFYAAMLFFMLLVILLSALTITLNTNFNDAAVSVTDSGKLTGTFGNAYQGISYATLSIGGVLFLWYLGMGAQMLMNRPSSGSKPSSSSSSTRSHL